MSLNELLDEISSKRQAAATPTISPSQELTHYERFLDALLNGKHPPFCELTWDGEVFHIVLQLHFQRAPEMPRPPGPEGQAVRRMAHRKFKKISPVEQKMISIRVTIKNWLPVTAEVAVRPEASGIFRLGTAQLQDWQKP